jgi:hypothetical protein
MVKKRAVGDHDNFAAVVEPDRLAGVSSGLLNDAGEGPRRCDTGCFDVHAACVGGHANIPRRS